MTEKPSRDPDAGKGAVDTDAPEQRDQVSIDGQLPHPMTGDYDGADTDFPEPGPREEHTGESMSDSNRTDQKKAPQSDRNPSSQGTNPEAENQTQEPGFSQKTNQNQQKEDPLAS
jgi:hypothetical protein